MIVQLERQKTTATFECVSLSSLVFLSLYSPRGKTLSLVGNRATLDPLLKVSLRTAEGSSPVRGSTVRDRAVDTFIVHATRGRRSPRRPPTSFSY